MRRVLFTLSRLCLHHLTAPDTTAAATTLIKPGAESGENVWIIVTIGPFMLSVKR